MYFEFRAANKLVSIEKGIAFHWINQGEINEEDSI